MHLEVVVRGRLVVEDVGGLTVLGERESDVKHVAELVVVCCVGILKSFAFGRLDAGCFRTRRILCGYMCCSPLGRI